MAAYGLFFTDSEENFLKIYETFGGRMCSFEDAITAECEELELNSRNETHREIARRGMESPSNLAYWCTDYDGSTYMDSRLTTVRVGTGQRGDNADFIGLEDSITYLDHSWFYDPVALLALRKPELDAVAAEYNSKHNTLRWILLPKVD